MKRTLHTLLFALALLATGNSQAQIHPLAFGPTNFYQNYVGIRFNVVAPGSIAGSKAYTAANSGNSLPADWGGFVSPPIVNIPVIMPPGTDSIVATTTLLPGSMSGKIALIYRGVSEFSHKAHQAQNAGAIACVIVNNAPGGPLGMGTGTEGSFVTIPVFMISQADGNAIDGKYRAGATVSLTISPWGQGLANDLGFVPQGTAGFHNFATPYTQLIYGAAPSAFNGMDGGFIANYGYNDATKVKMTDTLTYTPTGFSKTLVHTGVTPTLSAFSSLDSIYAMFDASEYTFAPATGKGRFDLKYTISSDSVDDFKGDNVAIDSFYATDSLYSKGSYDFVNDRPVSTLYEAASTGVDYIWGPTYYIRHGGTAISSVQFSVSSGTSGSLLGTTDVNVYAMKWTDGSAGQPLDGLVQNGELLPVAMGIYTFAPADTSGGTFKVKMGDPVTGIPGDDILLDSNSWYYIGVQVSGGLFLGCDGQASPYPRIYGRYHTTSSIEYSNIVWTGDYNTGSNPMTSFPSANEAPLAFPLTAYINTVDSFNYNEEKGLIPSVAMIVNNSPSLITGTALICAGTSTTLSDIVTGGTWTSSNTLVATINPTTGSMHGVAAGTSTITYSSTPISTKTVTVQVLPVVAPISGTFALCRIFVTAGLSDATKGGIWSSTVPGIASIDTGGTVFSMSAGTTTISYSVTNSCGTVATTAIFTVETSTYAGTISGAGTVCTGLTTPLLDAVTGGSWSSSNTTIASVSSAGIVSGVAAGIAVITYTVTDPCGTATATTTITVNTSPDAGTISGPDAVCVGNTISLTDVSSGGTWSSSGGTASVSSSGVVIGISSGIDVITYTVTNICGAANTQHLLTISDCINSVSNISGTNDIMVYPNPATDMVTIAAPVIINTLVITNMLGESVFNGHCAAKTTVVDMSRLPNGIYTFRINRTVVVKVVRQ